MSESKYCMCVGSVFCKVSEKELVWYFASDLSWWNFGRMNLELNTPVPLSFFELCFVSAVWPWNWVKMLITKSGDFTDLNANPWKPFHTQLSSLYIIYIFYHIHFVVVVIIYYYFFFFLFLKTTLLLHLSVVFHGLFCSWWLHEVVSVHPYLLFGMGCYSTKYTHTRMVKNISTVVLLV